MRLASPLLGMVLLAGCGFVVFPPNSEGEGGGGAHATSTTGYVPPPPDGPAPASSVVASSSSGAGGSTGFGDCANLAPCASSSQESLLFDGKPPQIPQAIVRARLIHGKGGPATAVQITACYVQIGDAVDFYPTLTLGSSPADLGPSTDATCFLDPHSGGEPFYGSTPNQPVIVNLLTIGDVDGVIEGLFEAVVSDGTSTFPLKGSFRACREPDLFAP